MKEATISPTSLTVTITFGLGSIYAFALSRMNLSIAYPLIIGFSAIFLLILSYLILNETITLNNFIGILLILFGIFLVYLK